MTAFIRLFAVFSLLSIASGPAQAAEPLQISGCSVSTLAYLEDLAKVYERETGVKVIVRGGGSIVGLTDLGKERVDIAASCKSSGPQDPADFEFITAAWDALVFIVHPANPVSDINLGMVRSIYDGTITNWKQLGGPDRKIISIISTPDGMGGVGEALAEQVLKGKKPERRANSHVEASSVAIWEQLVAETPDAFASTGFGSARKRKVKMLNFNGVPPTKENIISGAYPLKRRLYLVLKKDSPDEARKFVKFVLSRRGQALISSYGIPSIEDMGKR